MISAMASAMGQPLSPSDFHRTTASPARKSPSGRSSRIVEIEPVMKGQTAANSFKPAILDNGVRIMIPPFVGEGEDIIVNTEVFEYSERA